MTTILIILIVVAALVLILVVLVQKSKGGGLSSSFSSSNAIMGVRKTTDVVEKVTWGLIGFIMVASIACVTFRDRTVEGSQPKVTVPAAAPTESSMPNMGIPAAPAQQEAPTQQEAPAPAPAN